MKSVIIILLMLFVNVLFSQDRFIGDRSTKSESMDENGTRHFRNLVVSIREDSIFKILAAYRVVTIFNQTKEATFIISEGNWVVTDSDSVLQMNIKYKLTNEVETKYFKNFPRLALVSQSEEIVYLVEPIYKQEIKTQATILHKVKSDPKLKEFLDKKEKQP